MSYMLLSSTTKYDYLIPYTFDIKHRLFSYEMVCFIYYWYFCEIHHKNDIHKYNLEGCHVRWANCWNKINVFIIVNWILPFWSKALVSHSCTINSSPPSAAYMHQWIGSDNGLSPIHHQSNICTNAGLLSIGPLETNFSEIWIKIKNFSFTKVHLKRASVKWWPFCPGEMS